MSKPYIALPTNTRFYVPQTLAADFDRFLEQDIPNTVMDFEILKSWYEKESPAYIPKYVRGELYPDSTKSRYENTDNNMNIRCSVHSGIRKGDMLIQDNGTVYVLDWGVVLESNNAPSRALRCNMMLNVKRFRENEDQFDDYGYLVQDPTTPWKEIVPPIPCNAYRYDGRPEYSAISGTPGITPGALTLLVVQYNERTKDIQIDDQFDWHNETYRIVDIDRVGVSLNEENGTLKLQAKKMEGGLHGYE